MTLKTENTIGDSLDDMREPLKSSLDSVEGTILVASHLQRIGQLLYELSESLVETNDHLDTVGILGLNMILPYYIEELPQVLKEQLDAAHKWLPIGCIDNPHILSRVISKSSQASLNTEKDSQ